MKVLFTFHIIKLMKLIKKLTFPIPASEKETLSNPSKIFYISILDNPYTDMNFFSLFSHQYKFG